MRISDWSSDVCSSDLACDCNTPEIFGLRAIDHHFVGTPSPALYLAFNFQFAAGGLGIVRVSVCIQRPPGGPDRHIGNSRIRWIPDQQRHIRPRALRSNLCKLERENADPRVNLAVA